MYICRQKYLSYLSNMDNIKNFHNRIEKKRRNNPKPKIRKKCELLEKKYYFCTLR